MFVYFVVWFDEICSLVVKKPLYCGPEYGFFIDSEYREWFALDRNEKMDFITYCVTKPSESNLRCLASELPLDSGHFPGETEFTTSEPTTRRKFAPLQPVKVIQTQVTESYRTPIRGAFHR